MSEPSDPGQAAMRASLLAVAWIASAVSCKRSESPPVTGPAGARAADAKPASGDTETAAGLPVGVAMASAFEPLDARAAKNLTAGHAALRARKYAAARDLFHLVVAARPDHTAARFQELRAALRAGDLAGVPDLWRELLARDFVGYAAKLDSLPEFAPLRSSPLWAELARVRAEVRGAYAYGLDRGLLFVARSQPAKEQLYDEKARPVLELFQEAYHLDHITGRIRRLTDSGGRVFAIMPDRAHRRLVLLLVDGLAQNDYDSGWSFLLFKAAVLSLETLETTGPAAIPNAGVPAPEVVMCVSESGDALWTTTASYALDPARKQLTVVQQSCAPDAGVTVRTNRGARRRSLPPGVALVDGGRTLTLPGAPALRRDGIRSASVAWSPAKTRLVFSGDFNSCPLGIDDVWPASAENELLVWDVAAKKTARVAKAFSFFEWDWLDDDHLAYEAGPKTKPRLAVHEFSTGKNTVIPTRAGAGLVAIPSVECVYSTAEGP